MGRYSRYVSGEGFTDAIVEFAVMVLLITVVLGVIAWIVSRFWLWFLIIGAVVLGVYIAVRIVRRRREMW